MKLKINVILSFIYAMLDVSKSKKAINVALDAYCKTTLATTIFMPVIGA